MKLITTIALVAALMTNGVFASPATGTTNIHFVNKCPTVIELYDNHGSIPLQPGQTFDRMLPMGWMGMFRHGKNPQATLAEFTMAGGKAWFDISIIPTAPGKGPDFCPSLDACKAHTGGVGYNVPMQITPKSGINGAHCRELTCMADGCPDAYLFPKDDTKTHNCPYGTDFDLTFCPGGSGGTPPAIYSPAPTTPAPTTAAPAKPYAQTASAPELEKTYSFNGTLSKDDNAPGSVKADPDIVEAGVQEEGSITQSKPQAETPVENETQATTPTTPDTTAPVVQANTKASSKSGNSVVGYVVLSFLAVGATIAVAMAIVMRRKKLELAALEAKNDLHILAGV